MSVPLPRPLASPRPGRRAGFTLVELLVVIAIILVVMGLLLPAFIAALAQARAVVCANNIRQVVIGMQGYASDYQGQYPINVRLPSPGLYWYDKARVGAFLGAQPQRGGQDTRSALRCPEDDGALRSYSMNFWASSAVDPAGHPEDRDWPGGRFWKQPTRGAWKLILVTEAFSGRGSPTAGWVAPPTVGAQGVSPGLRFGAGGGVPTSAGRFGLVFSEIDYGRHRLHRGNGSGTEPVGRAHFGYADGHVGLMFHSQLADPVTAQSGLDSLWSPKDEDLGTAAAALAGQP